MKFMKAQKIELEKLDFDKVISRRDFCKTTAKLAVLAVLPVAFLSKCGVSLFPDDEQNGILPFCSFEIKFSKPMNKDSFVNGLLITPVNNKSSLKVQWSENDTVAYCKYYVENDGTIYNVTLSSSITDTLSIPLEDQNGAAGGCYAFPISA